jgi:K+-transporting ATPase KdpF subunit
MKTNSPLSLILLLIVPATSRIQFTNSQDSYFIGGIIAVFIMGYLIYTLLHPEKF